MDQLAPSYRVLAPDMYGSGRSPDWPSPRRINLHDEVSFIEPILSAAGPQIALVGHSYGAAVALRAAVEKPGSVSALALYEPTLFSLVDGEQPAPNDADEMRDGVREAADYLDHGYVDAAAQSFVDYWSGRGTWAAMPPGRQAPIMASIPNIARWGYALFSEPTPLEAFAALDIPVLYMVGKKTRRPASAVARVL